MANLDVEIIPPPRRRRKDAGKSKRQEWYEAGVRDASQERAADRVAAWRAAYVEGFADGWRRARE